MTWRARRRLPPPRGAAVPRTRRFLAAAAILLLAGCAALQPAARVSDRASVIGRIIGVTVKVTVEREGKRVSSASGVVVASGPEGESREPVSYVLTARHAVEKVNGALFVRVAEEQGRVRKLQAELYRAAGGADLALLRVAGVSIPPVSLADPPQAQLGEGILLCGFPWGKRLGLFAGIVSQVPGEAGEGGAAEDAAGEQTLVVDALSASGVSGGGVFREATGTLLGVVEGFQTASIAVEGQTRAYSLKVPLPGETFVVPADRIRAFLRAAGSAVTAGAAGP